MPGAAPVRPPYRLADYRGAGIALFGDRCPEEPAAPIEEPHGIERLRDRLGPRQELDRDLFERGEGAVGAGHQLGEVVAGDVLHHLAACLEDLATAADRLEAEEMVARGARLDAARPRQIAGEDPAQGR